MTQLQTQPERNTIVQWIMSKKNKDQIALALPKHMTADRLARIALTEVRKNPKLQQCSIESFASSVLTASQLGLEIGSAFGQAYLVPYGKDCQLIMGYRGMVQLAHRSGQIKSIHADVVYDNDLFEYSFGIDPKFKHVRNAVQGNNITYAYAYASLIYGGFECIVLKKNEVDKIKDLSRSANIWTNHYEEMAKKTALRRLFKMLPVSADIMKAMTIENARETGNMSFLSDFDGDDYIDSGISAEKNESDALAQEILAKNSTMAEEIQEEAR